MVFNEFSFKTWRLNFVIFGSITQGFVITSRQCWLSCSGLPLVVASVWVVVVPPSLVLCEAKLWRVEQLFVQFLLTFYASYLSWRDWY